jgi:hypothetical protein
MDSYKQASAVRVQTTSICVYQGVELGLCLWEPIMIFRVNEENCMVRNRFNARDQKMYQCQKPQGSTAQR